MSPSKFVMYRLNLSQSAIDLGRAGLETAKAIIKRGDLYPPNLETLPEFKKVCSGVVTDVRYGNWESWKLRDVAKAGILGLETISLFYWKLLDEKA